MLTCPRHGKSNCHEPDPPMPARYVIGQDGTILCADANADHARRPEPEELMRPREKAAAVAA